eukprot:gene6266-1118_t
MHAIVAAIATGGRRCIVPNLWFDEANNCHAAQSPTMERGPRGEVVVSMEGAGQYIRQPAHKGQAGQANMTVTKVQKYDTNGFLATIDNPVAHFHVYSSLQQDGVCGQHAKTTDQASAHQCLFATNGGPFQFTIADSCLGYTISDSLNSSWKATGEANFGLTQSGDFILGPLTPVEAAQLQFTNMLTGFDWLLRNGTIYPKNGGEVAPRTTVGTDAEGRLMIFIVDGIELSKPPKGTTLAETAEWMQELGFLHAINLDGGGSTAAVYQ